jgi:hypothetical protein
MRTLAVVAVLILGSVGVCLSFAQAVAEGAMLHANSAAATTRAGTALGDALSKVISRNAEKMKSVSSGKLEHVPHASRNSSGSRKSAQSSDPLVITSIRGGNKACAMVQPLPQATGNSSGKLNTKANDAADGRSGLGTASADDCRNVKPAQSRTKPVVNLTFPK